MITFTKEQLIASAHARIEFAEMMLAGELEPLKERTWSIELELARIALASLEAEPLCYLTWHQGFRAPDDCEEYVVEAKPGDKSCDGTPAFPVYTAPPAPVVPDLKELEAILDWILLLPCPTPKATHMAKRLAVVIDACRAAMLQGAEPVTTAYKLPEGWVACSERMPEDRESVLLWDIDLDDACSGHYSHETGNFYQSGMIIDNEITHWMPLPAAPQQEVKNG